MSGPKAIEDAAAARVLFAELSAQFRNREISFQEYEANMAYLGKCVQETYPTLREFLGEEKR